MFNLDMAGTITKTEWGKFLREESGWTYKLVEDRFSSLIDAKSEGVGAHEQNAEARALGALGVQSSTAHPGPGS